MNDMGPGQRTAARSVTWPLVPLLLVGMVFVSLHDPEPAEAGLSVHDFASNSSYSLGLLACWLVGIVLTLRVPEQGAGWAFLGLGTVMAWSGFVDTYTEVALGGRVDDLPGGELWATLGDTSFVWWFLVLTLCLYLTPASRPSWRGWRWLPWIALGSALVYQPAALLRSTHLAAPYDDIVSPLAVPTLAAPAAAVAAVAVVTSGLCLLASVYVLLSAFGRSRGEERQQLLWLVAGALPLVPGTIIAFAVSFTNHDVVAGWILTACIILLAAGAGLSVAKYRLYDVERVVTDSAAYAMASGAVITAFALVVVVITRSIPVASSSQLPTVLATLAGAGIARPAYVWARSAVDRRFNRRRFDAVRRVEQGLAEGVSDLDALVSEALGDPSARVLFRAGDAWVTADGRAAEPTTSSVDVVRRAAVAAKVVFDPDVTDRGVVEAVALAAAAEIDNVGLRAELARQVEQVTESRARLATAHLHERRRIERDLHDGAQQRILAIALQLQSARVNDTPDVLRAEIDRAVESLGATVQELRDLASGLQPAALAGGGLRAATEELASRIPVRMRLDVVDQRFGPELESAAWFVVAEGVSNAIKHSGVGEVAIAAYADSGALHLVVTDHGIGGVDPRGSGLQGLSDRVAALGGRLLVGPGALGGTRLEAVLPCGS
jgi:signal transduction histidine kinase